MVWTHGRCEHETKEKSLWTSGGVQKDFRKEPAVEDWAVIFHNRLLPVIFMDFKSSLYIFMFDVFYALIKYIKLYLVYFIIINNNANWTDYIIDHFFFY